MEINQFLVIKWTFALLNDNYLTLIDLFLMYKIAWLNKKFGFKSKLNNNVGIHIQIRPFLSFEIGSTTILICDS